MSSIALRGVRFSYGPNQPVLSDLNLVVEAAEIVGLLGANGAGKTTTFRLLAGLLRPDGGEIEVADVSVLAQPREARRRLAYMPDEPMLYTTLSALENLDLFGRLWEVPPAEVKRRGEELLASLGLWEVRKQWVNSYSRGMQQKLSLAVSLLHQPRVLLLDEPFTGLDIESGLWARDLLRSLADRGDAVLFSSHIPELVEALADRVVLLDQGRIVYDQPSEKVRQDGGMVAVFSARSATSKRGRGEFAERRAARRAEG